MNDIISPCESCCADRRGAARVQRLAPEDRDEDLVYWTHVCEEGDWIPHPIDKAGPRQHTLAEHAACPGCGDVARVFMVDLALAEMIMEVAA